MDLFCVHYSKRNAKAKKGACMLYSYRLLFCPYNTGYVDMVDLLNRDIVQKFVDDADRIRDDREAQFLIIEAGTARTLLAYLGEYPAADLLRGIDWDKYPIAPITKYAATCIRAGICI